MGRHGNFITMWTLCNLLRHKDLHKIVRHKDGIPTDNKATMGAPSQEAPMNNSEPNMDMSRHRISVFLSAHTAYELLLEWGKLMILVDDIGGLIPAINHSPWNGVTLADFVMPFFLFIVGVSLTLAYKRVPNRIDASKKAVLRSLKLLIVGLLLQGGYFHGVNHLTYGVDLSTIRLMGVLQRIAIAYIVAAVCEIWLKTDVKVYSGWTLLIKYKFQLLVALILSLIYILLLYGLYVPDWEYQVQGKDFALQHFSVKCGVRGDSGPACNAGGMIDRKLLGIQHLYKRPIYARTKECSMNSPSNGPFPSNAPSYCQAPFDPKGILRFGNESSTAESKNNIICFLCALAVTLYKT